MRFATMLAAMLLAGWMVLAPQPARAAGWDIQPVRALLGGVEPHSEGIRIELPLLSEDGSAVPITIAVEQPTSGNVRVEVLHLFAAGNPTPEVAEFYFPPDAPRVEVSSRIRLNASGAVVALARLSNGEFRVATRDIRITISGCMTRSDWNGIAMQSPRVAVPLGLLDGSAAEIRTMIDHPMETGLRENAEGAVVPQRIIERVTVELDQEPLFEARLFRPISANPYLRFPIRARAGELSVTWTEDSGHQVTERRALRVD
jgi:sulfur-oxidizing protein SoxY